MADLKRAQKYGCFIKAAMKRVYVAAQFNILHMKTVNTDSFYSDYLVKTVDTDYF